MLICIQILSSDPVKFTAYDSDRSSVGYDIRHFSSAQHFQRPGVQIDIGLARGHAEVNVILVIGATRGSSV